MPFDFAPDDRQSRGLTSYRDGICAEDSAARLYAARGYRIVEQRWRGLGGEIDLICRDDEGFVFVEVKKAASHDAAAHRLGPQQMNRIVTAAEEYVGCHSGDPLSPMRLDLAMVDGSGRVETLENVSLC